jgi:hypothetical protein
MNWSANINSATVAPQPVATPDAAHADNLRAALVEGKVAARDADFARSLLAGFDRYGSFTPKQLPHVVRLAGGSQPQAPALNDRDAVLAGDLSRADTEGRIPERDRDFARSLLRGYARYHAFTDRQRPYVERLLAASAPVVEAPAPAVEAPAAVPTFPNIINALRAALDKGLQCPSLRFAGGVVKLPAGYDYALVRDGSVKLGVISVATQRARLRYPSRTLPLLQQLEADVLGGLQTYGQKTGRCGCCGRTLTRPTSVSLGIGPICASKFGFTFAGVDLSTATE